MGKNKEVNLAYRRSKKGLIRKAYYHQRETSVRRGHPAPEYTLDELLEFSLNHNQFNTLHEEWVLSDYEKNLKPSIDRIDEAKHYLFNNIQWVTWSFNNQKERLRQKSGLSGNSRPVIGENIESGKIVEFTSARRAAEELGLERKNISACCHGKRNICGNYYWKFKN